MVKIVEGSFPKEEEISLYQCSATYIQNPDCTEDVDKIGCQELTISTRDNGVANFLNIKTDNWSIDNAESLKEVIEDFCKRIGYDEK